MNCQDVRHHWMLYLDSEGDAELHLRINEHLGMCPTCAEWMARQQRFEQALADRLAAGAATPELWHRILSRACIRAPVTRWRPRFALVAALAAAFLLAIGIGLRIAGPARSS